MTAEPTPTLRWRAPEGDTPPALELLDQTLLPGEVAVRVCDTVERVAEAIEVLCVRGAPAIGVAAAYGVALAARPGSMTSA